MAAKKWQVLTIEDRTALGYAFSGKLLLVLTRLPIPPNVHNHGPLKLKQELTSTGFS